MGRRPTDQELDDSVAWMLRIGVSAAATVVLAGGLLLLRHPEAAVADYSRFAPSGPRLRTVDGIARGAMRLDAPSIVQLGLLVLIATPVARVGFCLIGFARQKSALYVGVSTLVLVILIYSLTKGGR